MIEFHLLGQISLVASGRATVDDLLRLPKRLAVLAFLAYPVPGTWHRRDTLLGLFWPEHTQDRARSALRNTLYVLRHHLGETAILTRGGGEVAINPAALQTDVGRLRRLLSDGDPAAALEAYPGDLLPGLHVIGAPGFDRWLDGERDRLRGEVTATVRAHATRLAEQGAVDAAIQVTRRLVMLDPQDERLVRSLMFLHEQAGDRAGGLRAFESYRLHLKQEFGAEPSGETVALAARLRLPGRTVELAPAPGGEVAPPNPPAPGRSVRGRPGWSGVVGTAALVVACVLGWRTLRSDAGPPVVGTSQPVTAESGLQVEPALAPDGRLVAYAGGSLLHLRIRVARLAGGDAWAIAPDTLGSQRVPRWAPGGEVILFLGGNHAYLAPALGGEVRLVAEGGEDERSIRSASWSPRGDSIAIVRGDSLMVIPRDGIGARLVGIGHQLHTCSWSPTGEWIACVSGNWVALMPGPLFGNRGQSGIVLFPARGGVPRDLTGARHDHRAPAWAPDGRTLWMLSDRGGSGTEAYVARISAGGRREGDWRRVGLPAEFLSIGEDRLIYSVPSRRANVFSLPADTGRLQMVAEARPQTRGTQIVEVVRSSPDGAWLLYDSNVGGNSDVYRQPVDGGRPERLTDDPREEFAPDLSPDGRLVAYHRWEAGVRRLVVLDLTTGGVMTPDTLPGDQSVPRWSPDGDGLIYWEHGAEPGSIVMLRRTPAGGWRRAWRLPGGQLPAWSPDGRVLAFVLADGGVRRIPADSGPTEVIYSPVSGGDDPIITYLAFDPDRPLLWMLGHLPRGGSGIWVLPLVGGAPRHVVDLVDPDDRATGPSLSTDGRRLYFTLDEHLSNIRSAALPPR